MKRLALIAFLCAYNWVGIAQNNATQFAEFIVEGVPSVEAYRAVDDHMRVLPHVIMSRMDIPTQRYYIVFDSSAGFDEQWFINKFNELGGYSIHCFFLGQHGQDEFIPITAESCSELNNN